MRWLLILVVVVGGIVATRHPKVRNIVRVVASVIVCVIVFPEVALFVILAVFGIVIGVYNTIFPPPPPWWCSIQGSEKIPACLR